MSSVIKPTSAAGGFSSQMCAVLILLSADDALWQLVEPFICLESETIRWEEIFSMPLEAGQQAAITWAYSIWSDAPKPDTNCFASALSMNPVLQNATLQALARRWALNR